MIDLSVKVTQRAFGEMVGISQPTVSDLVSRGVLLDSDTAGGWLLAYCRNLREVAAGRMAAGDLDLATERAGLARAQREKIEMQNAERRKELAPAFLIEEVLAKAGAKVSGILDAIPGAIKRRESGLSAASVKAIQTEIAKARNVVAGMSLADLSEDEAAGDADEVIDGLV